VIPGEPRDTGIEIFVMANRVSTSEALAERVQFWEQLGVSGILMPDHFFVSHAKGRPAVQPDPFVVLAAIGALSGHLKLGTIVANCGVVHPAWILRHLAQLAALYGGERVVAGLGAGWNAEEFEALGLAMPPHAERTRRLQDSLVLARQLFDEGVASISTAGFAAHDLPVDVGPTAPRLLVGGGSDRILELAARYADHLDLNGSSRRAPIGRSGAAQRDGVRRLTTTTADLAESAARVRELAERHGRPDAVRFSLLLDTVDLCPASQAEERREELARARGVEGAPVSDCPYVLIGSPDEMSEVLAERIRQIGLSALLVLDGPAVPALLESIVPRIRDQVTGLVSQGE
jgi:alkanesulfonate monooxygenase SsuD/methylene tetrahydromethanopterin reductase-like flavin-dependent oxidoreductase (luciferase family)